jgi:hypothetical protein
MKEWLPCFPVKLKWRLVQIAAMFALVVSAAAGLVLAVW